jgi:predicted PurR-regulated permease PerM
LSHCSDGEEDDVKSSAKPKLQISDVVKQIGQLYKMTRKVAAAQKKLQEQLDEVKKAATDKVAATEKTILFQLKAANQQRAQQLKQQEEEKANQSMVSKLKSVRQDPVAMIQLLFIVVMVWYMLFSGSSTKSLSA